MAIDAQAFPLDEALIRGLADALPQIVFVDSKDGVPEYWNARWYEYSGLTHEESMGPQRYSIVHPDDRRILLRQWPLAIRAGRPFEMELRVLRAADGMYRWHLSRAVPQRDERGQIVHWYGTLTDIDDQKRVEEALLFLSDASNRFAATLNVETTLRRLAEAAIDGFADWCSIYRRNPNGSVSTVAIAHKEPEKLRLARQLAIEFPPQGADPVAVVISEGEPMLFPDISESTMRQRVAHPRQLELLLGLGLRSAMILPVKSAGRTLGALSLVSSESGRIFNRNDLSLAQTLVQRAALAWENALLYERNQQSLRDSVESEQRFRNLAEMIPAMVWVSDPDGTLRYANNPWLAFFACSAEDLPTWELENYVHPEDFASARERWRSCLQTGAPYQAEYRALNQHGQYEWLLVRGHAVQDETGQTIRWFGTSTSIDEQKRAFERQRMVVDTLQEAFIPKVLPSIPGVSFDAAYFPAEKDARVGGDWYDAIALDDHLLLFSIGDVCGHGLDAAVTMGRVRQAITGAALDTEDAGSVLTKVNRLLALQKAPMVTAVVGFIDLRTNLLTMASAGHPPAILVANGNVQLLQHGDIPLGVEPSASYQTRSFPLDRETFVMLYTDGLIEARRDVENDEQRVLLAAQSAASGFLNAVQIREQVLQETLSSDDVAILTIRIKPRT